MVERQPFGTGTIDRLLLEQQILLTAETRPVLYGEEPTVPKGSSEDRPQLDEILAQIAPAGSQRLARMLAITRWCSRIPRDYPRPGPSTVGGCYGDFSSYHWGGSEETVVAKGSPWPQEVSRVLATLLRRAGFWTRLVFLYRADPPALHTVVETWALGGWAVCDPCANRCYIWPHHGYASAADLQRQPWLVDQAPEHGHNPYVESAFYKAVAISHYPLSHYPSNAALDGAHALQPARPEDAPSLKAAAAVFASQVLASE